MIIYIYIPKENGGQSRLSLLGSGAKTSVTGRNHLAGVCSSSFGRGESLLKKKKKLPAASRNLRDAVKQGQLCEMNPPPVAGVSI